MTYRRHRGVPGVTIVALILTVAAMLGSGTPASAMDKPPDNTYDFPAGTACEFELLIDSWDNPDRVMREFKDKNGNVVRLLTAGKGSTLVFTNPANGQALPLKSNGAVQRITVNSATMQTWSITGHNVVILGPSDNPAGPSTTLYVGQVTFTVDSLTSVFTILSTSGVSTDICKALK